MIMFAHQTAPKLCQLLELLNNFLFLLRTNSNHEQGHVEAASYKPSEDTWVYDVL